MSSQQVLSTDHCGSLGLRVLSSSRENSAKLQRSFAKGWVQSRHTGCIRVLSCLIRSVLRRV